ncbi:MAG: hypothetical protein M3Z10_07420 [Gemmatimonadota bacterium]|nr:hypothetical protein [Gemmatimonadota bacterium]
MSFVRRLATLGVAIPTIVALAAAQSDAPAPGLARKPELSLAESHSVVSLGVEAYVLGYRRSVKVACQALVNDAPTAVLRDSRAIVAGLPDGERAQVEAALDSTFLDLTRAGGCPALTRPSRLVVVDSFEGQPWNASVRAVGSPDKGRYTDDGLLVMSRQTKVRGVRGEATFNFTAIKGSEKLVTGLYRFPVGAGECVERWRALEGDLIERYPTLRAKRELLLAPGTDSASWRAQCASFAATGGRWSTLFRNPDTDALEVAMYMHRAGDGRLAISVEYPGYTLR